MTFICKKSMKKIAELNILGVTVVEVLVRFVGLLNVHHLFLFLYNSTMEGENLIKLVTHVPGHAPRYTKARIFGAILAENIYFFAARLENVLSGRPVCL